MVRLSVPCELNSVPSTGMESAWAVQREFLRRAGGRACFPFIKQEASGLNTLARASSRGHMQPVLSPTVGKRSGFAEQISKLDVEIIFHPTPPSRKAWDNGIFLARKKFYNNEHINTIQRTGPLPPVAQRPLG